MKKFLLVTALAAIVSWPSILPAASYQIDNSHSVAGFTVRHMMVSNVSGAFSKLSGTVDFDSNNPSQSKVEVTIDADSVDTRNAGRDKDLRSANFFDVATYPTITFKSTKVDKAGEGKYRVVGNLTMHGVTKEVVLDVDGPTPEVQAQGGFRAGASATTNDQPQGLRHQLEPRDGQWRGGGERRSAHQHRSRTRAQSTTARFVGTHLKPPAHAGQSPCATIPILLLAGGWRGCL